MQNQTIKGFRASFLDTIADPFYAPEADCIRYFPDGLLIVESGKVKELGSYKDLQTKYADIPIADYRDRLIV